VKKFVVTAALTDVLASAALLLPKDVIEATLKRNPAVPAGMLWVSRDWHLWKLWAAPETELPPHVTHGQLAAAIMRRHQPPAIPTLHEEALKLRETMLKAAERAQELGRPCPFCEDEWHVATCPVMVLRANRWLTYDERLES
jgi:hypothetical protein